MKTHCAHGHERTADTVDGRGNCRICVRQRASEWAKNNRERTQRAKRSYKERHPVALRATERARRARNAEAERARLRALAAANPEAKRLSAKKYRDANPEVGQAGVQRRLARLANAPGAGVGTADWRRIRHEHGGRCAYCARPMRLSMDHIEPLSRGGAHDPENIVAACTSCNSSKADKSVLHWLATRPASLNAA